MAQGWGRGSQTGQRVWAESERLVDRRAVGRERDSIGYLSTEVSCHGFLVSPKGQREACGSDSEGISLGSLGRGEDTIQSVCWCALEQRRQPR